MTSTPTVLLRPDGPRKVSTSRRHRLPDTLWRVSSARARRREPIPTAGCLSGRGFRAALYGLGVVRYLAEAKLLARLEVICGVSGGSGASAAICSAVLRAGPGALSDEGFEREVVEPVRGGGRRREPSQRRVP